MDGSFSSIEKLGEQLSSAEDDAQDSAQHVQDDPRELTAFERAAGINADWKRRLVDDAALRAALTTVRSAYGQGLAADADRLIILSYHYDDVGMLDISEADAQRTADYIFASSVEWAADVLGGKLRDNERAALIDNALRVLALTPHVRAYLTARDPKALEQADRALGTVPQSATTEAQTSSRRPAPTPRALAAQSYGVDEWTMTTALAQFYHRQRAGFADELRRIAEPLTRVEHESGVDVVDVLWLANELVRVSAQVRAAAEAHARVRNAAVDADALATEKAR